jgi:hypothetical protein
VYYGTWNNCVLGNETTAKDMMDSQIGRGKDHLAFTFERYEKP